MIQENLLDLAEKRKTHTKFWWSFFWNTHHWFRGISYVSALCVPFGLAGLIYCPERYRNTLNVILLLLSATALILDIIIRVAKIEERAKLLRTITAGLEINIAKYKDGLINENEFTEVIERLIFETVKEGD